MANLVSGRERLGGQTICFPGLPGIGKTAALKMLKSHSASGDDVLCLGVELQDLNDPNAVFHAIANGALEKSPQTDRVSKS